MNRITNLPDSVWDNEMQISKNIFSSQPLKDFENYLYSSFQFFKNKNVIFDIQELKDELRKISKELDISLELLVKEFNKHFKYELQDFNEINLSQLKKQENIDLRKLDLIMILKLDTKFNNYDSVLIDIENIILKYFVGQDIKEKLFNYNINRKLSIYDFNEICLDYLSIDSLIFIIKQNYYHLNIKKISNVLIKKIEHQDKFYIEDYKTTLEYSNRIFDSKIKQDNKKYNLITELIKVKKLLIKNQIFVEEVDKFINEIIVQLQLVKIILKFNLLIDNKEYVEAYKYLDENLNTLTLEQTCLLAQVCSGIIDITINRYSVELKDISQQIVNKIINKPKYKLECKTYLFKENDICLHNTFHYYVLKYWVNKFNIIVFSKGVIPSNINNNFLSPNDKLNMSNEIIDPKDSFCNQCYKEYDNMKKYKFNLRNMKDLPKEVKYILYKYKNKSRISRMNFSDKCDIPSELPQDNNHFSQYVQATQGTSIMINELIKSIHEEIVNIYMQMGIHPYA